MALLVLAGAVHVGLHIGEHAGDADSSCDLCLSLAGLDLPQGGGSESSFEADFRGLASEPADLLPDRELRGRRLGRAPPL